MFATITTSAGATFKNALHCHEEAVPASGTGAQFTSRAREHGHESKYGACVKWKGWSPIQALPPHQVIGKGAVLDLEDPSEDQSLLLQGCSTCSVGSIPFGLQSSTSNHPPQYTTVHPALGRAATRRAAILVSGMIFSFHFRFCSVTHWIWWFPFASNRCIPLWAVLSLWRVHFSLYSHPVLSPLPSIPFPKRHHLPSASSSDLFLYKEDIAAGHSHLTQSHLRPK